MKIYFDGGCSPNPGKMSACIVICSDKERPKPLVIKDLGQGTNNVAEWSALLWAIHWAKDNRCKEAIILGDSLLAINQASGLWKINNQLLAELFNQFHEASQGIKLTLTHVPRASNLAGQYLEFGTI